MNSCARWVSPNGIEWLAVFLPSKLMKWTLIYRLYCSAHLSDPNGWDKNTYCYFEFCSSTLRHKSLTVFVGLFKNDSTTPELSGSKPDLFWHWKGCTDPAKMELCLHKVLHVAFTRNRQWKQKSMNKPASDHQAQFSQLVGGNFSVGQNPFEICLLQRKLPFNERLRGPLASCSVPSGPTEHKALLSNFNCTTRQLLLQHRMSCGLLFFPLCYHVHFGEK